MNASVAICISQKLKSVPKFRLRSQGEGGCTLVLCLPVVGRAVGSTGGLMPTHAGLPVWPLRDTAKKGGQLRVWQGGVGVGWWLSSHRGQIFISAPAAACGGKGASQGQQSWQHRVPPLAFSSQGPWKVLGFQVFLQSCSFQWWNMFLWCLCQCSLRAVVPASLRGVLC